MCNKDLYISICFPVICLEVDNFYIRELNIIQTNIFAYYYDVCNTVKLCIYDLKTNHIMIIEYLPKIITLVKKFPFLIGTRGHNIVNLIVDLFLGVLLNYNMTERRESKTLWWTQLTDSPTHCVESVCMCATRSDEYIHW